MIYKLEFELHAKKEWDKLDKPIKEALKLLYCAA
jgi:mRNA-degrading endonuclease RelE of RelBE toxin-antitoxin system